MGKLVFNLWLVLLILNSAVADTILRGNGAEPETLDVHKSTGVPEANIQRDLFEGLVAEAADGSLIPGVARNWSISADGLVYSFKLKDDARWSNGDPVTAADFVYAFERALNPATASDYAFILWQIQNAQAYNKGVITEASAIGVKAVSSLELEIRLASPTPYFLELLAHHMAYPVPEKAIEQYGVQWTRPGHLVSNGPYQLVEWLPQSHVLLRKNPHYHSAETIKNDAIKYVPSEDKNAELKRFRANELDVTEDVPSTQIPWIRKNLADSFHSTPYIGTYYFAFNILDDLFREKPDLRLALALAIDRDILTGKVTRGGELPALGWVPPGVHGYQPQTMDAAAMDQKAREALARKLYAASGYGPHNRLELELLYNTSDNHKKIAIAIAAMWKKTLGVKTHLRNEEWKVYLDSRKRRDFQVIRAGWIGDYNDAYSFLSLFKSDVGDINPAGYQNPDYDELIRRAEQTIDPKVRSRLMAKAEKILLADLPIIPVYHYTTQHLINPDIKGWIDNVMDVHPSRFLEKTQAK